MQIFGELAGNQIIVKKQKDSGRLYSRSHLGTLNSKGQVKLDLLEGVFLLGEKKIKIFEKKTELDFQTLVNFAAQIIPEFEIKYLIFKDLRNKGLAIKNCDEKKQTTFYIFKQKKDEREKQCFISAFSERDILDLKETKNLIQDITKKNGELWFAIVDEEGDLTYYRVSLQDMNGDVSEHVYTKGHGILLKNRIVLFDNKLAKSLFQKEFFGKPFVDGLQLSLVEGLYLLEKKVIDISSTQGKKLSHKEYKEIIHKLQPDIKPRLLVFSDLKKSGLIVKTGFKFGVHFRAYTKQPDKTHAEYLIHVVDKDFKSIWAEMSRAVRLTHSVNKEIVFARIDGKNIDYIKFGRLRP
jgi:tRNA-intron endonuclease